MAFFLVANFMEEKRMYEVIWHGRGGQGAVVAAQILAETAYLQGYLGVTSAPTFGPERRGAPVSASTRIARDPIRIVSQIDLADIAVVLDATLFGVVDVVGRLKPGGLIIINTPLKPDDFKMNGSRDVACVDAVDVALKHHLIREGAPVINTAMLGAFSRASELVSLDNIEKALKRKLSSDAATLNFEVVRSAYAGTAIRKKT
ncbi:MAG: 2-oxoacid:acceptor oxidoreductase family protein [Deltaproteobacteria bacterium]|nr:2-oxoacid:acceptor oxidoreductase family protein [Deltaproteobacteria bacterium]